MKNNKMKTFTKNTKQYLFKKISQMLVYPMILCTFMTACGSGSAGISDQSYLEMEEMGKMSIDHFDGQIVSDTFFQDLFDNSSRTLLDFESCSNSELTNIIEGEEVEIDCDFVLFFQTSIADQFQVYAIQSDDCETGSALKACITSNEGQSYVYTSFVSIEVNTEDGNYTSSSRFYVTDEDGMTNFIMSGDYIYEGVPGDYTETLVYYDENDDEISSGQNHVVSELTADEMCSKIDENIDTVTDVVIGTGGVVLATTGAWAATYSAAMLSGYTAATVTLLSPAAINAMAVVAGVGLGVSGIGLTVFAAHEVCEMYLLEDALSDLESGDDEDDEMATGSESSGSLEDLMNSMGPSGKDEEVTFGDIECCEEEDV
jgi:hypothetical protein